MKLKRKNKGKNGGKKKGYSQKYLESKVVAIIRMGQKDQGRLPNRGELEYGIKEMKINLTPELLEFIQKKFPTIDLEPREEFPESSELEPEVDGLIETDVNEDKTKKD